MEPMALVMTGVAVTLATVAISFGVRARDRLFALALAIISGVTAWMMASRWRWPQ